MQFTTVRLSSVLFRDYTTVHGTVVNFFYISTLPVHCFVYSGPGHGSMNAW